MVQKYFKRLLSMLLSLCLCLSAIPMSTYASGEAWEGYTPISSAQELKEKIEANMAGKYYLTNDITLTGRWDAIGWLDRGDVAFTGVFDGNGHTIRGLQHTSNGQSTYVGLFAINEGLIRNFTLVLNQIDGYQYVGAVAGKNGSPGQPNALIQNVIVEHSPYRTDYGVIANNSDNTGGYAGGITGQNYGKVYQCGTNIGTVSAYNYAGGIAGGNWGTIEQCYAKGGINAKYYTNQMSYSTYYIGGLVGGNVGTIQDCYVNLKSWVVGTGRIGGFVGMNSGGTLTHCYAAHNNKVYTKSGPTQSPFDFSVFIGLEKNGAISEDTWVTGDSGNAKGAEYITYDNLRNREYVESQTAFDFDHVWTYQQNVNDGYPIFGWEADPVITGFDKELVSQEIAGLNLPDGITIAYPQNNRIVINEGNSVTLLYKITVTGDAGAEYRIADEEAIVVSGNLEGTIPEDANQSIVYVIKTYTAQDINEQGKLANTATVSAGAKTVLDNSVGTASALIDAVETRTCTVTFQIENGTWADGGTGDKTVDVILTAGEGTLSGEAVPSGMQANANYEGGAWDVTPNTEAGGITGDVTYKYAFTPTTGSATVTFRVENGTWADGGTGDKTVDVILTAGEGTLSGEAVPSGMQANADYEGGAWDVTPNTEAGGITGDVTYTYAFTPTTGSATVTFRVENGTWADGGTGDKTVDVILAAGEGTLSGEAVPSGMQANANYEGGAWDVTPNTEAGGITGDVTYTYAFTRRNSSGGGGGSYPTFYTLTYSSNGGTEYKDERYASGTTVKLSKVPARNGYTFTGWYGDESCTEKIETILMNGNKIVYAGWTQSKDPSKTPDLDPTDMLNQEEHFAYILGYRGGLVRPEANITRAEVTMIFFRLLKEDVREQNLSAFNSFTDVGTGQWHNTAISTMAGLGIVDGYASGCFKPDAPITRAEFAAIAARFSNKSADNSKSFTDVSGHWAEKAIGKAFREGWVNGYSDGTFKPNNRLTRAEAIAMINRVLNRNPETPDDLLPEMITWEDNMDPAKWYYMDIQEASNSHEFERKDNQKERWTRLTNG